MALGARTTIGTMQAQCEWFVRTDLGVVATTGVAIGTPSMYSASLVIKTARITTGMDS